MVCNYLDRYGSIWFKFQLKLSILDQNPFIQVNWAHGPMGYRGGGPLAESSRCRQELRQKSRKRLWIYMLICTGMRCAESPSLYYMEYNGDLDRHSLFKCWYEVGTKFDNCSTKFVKHSTKYNPEMIKYRP